jgi:hypothetical protein
MVIVAGLSLSGHRFRDLAAAAQIFAVTERDSGFPLMAYARLRVRRDRS